MVSTTNFGNNIMTFLLQDAKVVDLDQVLRGPRVDQIVKYGSLTWWNNGKFLSPISFFRVIYNTKKQFMRIAQKLGIMDDFKSGVPRMAYKVFKNIF